MLAFMFLEPSTRTFASFWKAAVELGLSPVDVTWSAMEKGECLQDTLKTLELLGYSGVVLRHSYDNASYDVDIPIIDAGSGRKSHPSQAAIDVRTMLSVGLDPHYAKIAFLGDTVNSRVYRSLIKECRNTWVCESADDAVRLGADIFYCLRPQTERGYDGDYSRYRVTREHMDNSSAYLMHPGPFVDVEFDRSLLDHERSLIYAQVRNAVPIRKEILSYAFRGIHKGL